MQCIALSFEASTSFARTISVVPFAIMTGLTLNIVMTMKATQTIFESNTLVLEFRIVQIQLFLLTSNIPFNMLFWEHQSFRRVRNLLGPLVTTYTYAQTCWFWTAGYRNSDEMVCKTAETEVNHWKHFEDNASWAIRVLYLFGTLVLLPLAITNYVRAKPGIFNAALDASMSRAFGGAVSQRV